MFDEYSNQMEKASAGSLAPRRITRRERLTHEIEKLEVELEFRRKALEALDNNPELEKFIEILQRAGL